MRYRAVIPQYCALKRQCCVVATPYVLPLVVCPFVRTVTLRLVSVNRGESSYGRFVDLSQYICFIIQYSVGGPSSWA